MIELPEAAVLTKQLNQALKGKRINKVIMNQSPHKFAWFNGDPNQYESILKDKLIDEAVNYNGLVEVKLGDAMLLFGDGVNLRYYSKDEKHNQKNQLFLEFDDSSKLTGSVQMYGGLWAFLEGQFKNPYYQLHKQKPSVLSNEFSETYFKSLLIEESETGSVKAFLATNQRIPGLGNGVLQDILYYAKIHPKRKMNTLSEMELGNLYQSIKTTIYEMTTLGGRDTEKDLYGNSGGYQTKVSKNTVDSTCPLCQSVIKKEAYLGGSIYYCEGCQKV